MAMLLIKLFHLNTMERENEVDALEHTTIIKLSNERIKYVNKNYVRISCKMYDSSCDVRLRASERVFRAHRAVLSAASAYFAAMFGHEMRERTQPAIELGGVSARGFATMMHYLYRGYATLSRSSIGDVLEAARFFQIDWLLAVGRHCLVTTLATVQLDLALQIADTHYIEGDVRADVLRFVGENFAELVSDDACCGELSLEVLEELLTGDHYVSATEGYVAGAVVRWLVANGYDAQTTDRLLRLLRYPLLDECELAALPDIVGATLPDLMAEAREYHACESAQCVRTSARTRVRGARTMLVLISAVDDAYAIEYRTPESDITMTADFDSGFMRATFEHASTAVLGNFLFTAGGYDRRTWYSSNACYRYDPRGHTWDELPPMQDARVSFGLCASASRLYAVGGVDHTIKDGVEGDTILASVEAYDPLRDTWSHLAALPLACFNAAVAATADDDSLYVTGGISDDPEHSVPTAYLHVYTGDTWRRCADMPTPRHGHVSVVTDRRVFVCGGHTAAVDDTAGFDRCATSEVYDTQTDQWTTLVTASAVGHVVSVATLGQQLYMLSAQPDALHAVDMRTGEPGEEQPVHGHARTLVVLDLAFPGSFF